MTDNWASTITRHLREDLKMEKITLDLRSFFKRLGRSLQGLLSIYVDDGIHSGAMSFLKECYRTQERFRSIDREMDLLKFARVEFETILHGVLLEQKAYVAGIQTDAVGLFFLLANILQTTINLGGFYPTEHYVLC